MASPQHANARGACLHGEGYRVQGVGALLTGASGGVEKELYLRSQDDVAILTAIQVPTLP